MWPTTDKKVQAHHFIVMCGHGLNWWAGFEKVKKGGYDLVLMDCQMPVMDGYSATKAIRQFEAQGSLDKTPIVALTAHALENDKDKCLSVGMDEYLTKPISKVELTKTLRKYLKAEGSKAESTRRGDVRSGVVETS
eukprot:TRINITY_DN3389_c0_g1_i1.p2 TRINITY_DN3389_c0_g1~~TRINITY_DN3389_c0_g1_i1.p2  ORF type:complete len:136 (-),score=8.96 TRINITY_DN3389_c0_g1_i1:186-593(-)